MVINFLAKLLFKWINLVCMEKLTDISHYTGLSVVYHFRTISFQLSFMISDLESSCQNTAPPTHFVQIYSIGCAEILCPNTPWAVSAFPSPPTPAFTSWAILELSGFIWVPICTVQFIPGLKGLHTERQVCPFGRIQGLMWLEARMAFPKRARPRACSPGTGALTRCPVAIHTFQQGLLRQNKGWW